MPNTPSPSTLLITTLLLAQPLETITESNATLDLNNGSMRSSPDNSVSLNYKDSTNSALIPYILEHHSIFAKIPESSQSAKPIEVDEAFIKSKIIGYPAEKNFYAQAILIARDSSPIIKEYIDLVLQNFKQFQMVVAPKRYMQSANNSNVFANYNIPFQIMLLPNNINNIQQDYAIRILKHEFRHVAFHYIQISQQAKNNINIQPFYPLTNEEYLNFKNQLQLSDNFIIFNIYNYLEKEKSSMPMELTEVFILQNIRQTMKDSHLLERTLSLSMEEIEKIKGKNIDLNTTDTINIDFIFPRSFGDFTIKELTKLDKTVSLKIKFIDPVRALILYIIAIDKHVKNNYSENAYLQERDAYLYEDLPPELVQILYYLNSKSQKEFIQQAKIKGIPKNLIASKLWFTASDKDLGKALDEKVRLFLDFYPAFLNADNSELVLEYGLRCLQRDEKSAAEQAFVMLRHKGLFVNEANAHLGFIAYKNNNYKDAYRYLNHAFKQNFDNSVYRIFYGDALLEMKFYKKAEKQLRIAINDINEILQQNLNQNDPIMHALRNDLEFAEEKHAEAYQHLHTSPSYRPF